MGQRIVAAGVLFAIWIDGGSAKAQPTPLEDALSAYDQGAVDVALERFEAALRTSHNDVPHLVLIYRHLGFLRRLFGDRDGGRRAVEYALALDPMAAPVGESGPEDRELFHQLRAARGEQRVRLTLERPASLDRQASISLRVRVEGSPEGLVRSVRLRTGTAAQPDGFASEVTGTLGTVDLPPSAWSDENSIETTLEAVDEFGNVLVSDRQTLEAAPISVDPVQEPIAVVDPPAPVAQPPQEVPILSTNPEDDRSRPVTRHPAFWTGIGAVVLGAAILAVVLTQRDRDPSFGSPMLVDP